MPKAPKVKVSASGTHGKLLHPNSRKAAAQAKKEHHNAKIIRRKQEGNMKIGVRGERLLWFRNNLDSEKTVYSKDDVRSSIESYLNRFADELRQIEAANSIQGRQGRQFAAREDAIKFQLIKDAREFETSGLDIPDLFDEENVSYLRDWSGELRFLTNIKTRPVTRKELQ